MSRDIISRELSLEYYIKARETNLQTYKAKMDYMKTVKEKCIAKYENSLATINNKINAVVNKYEKSFEFYDSIIKRLEQKNMKNEIKKSVAQSLSERVV